MFEEAGGDLGDTSLKLVGLNVERQELLFQLGEADAPVLVDMSPGVSGDGYDAGAALDDVNPDA